MPAAHRKKQVGVLGATGTVGQRFIVLLACHPLFELVALGASARSAGKAYGQAVKWKQSVPIPLSVAQLEVNECSSSFFQQCDIVFSGLDHDVAGDIGKFLARIISPSTKFPAEKAFREADLAVFSNAKNYRRDPVVPLVVPLVNTSHFDIIPHQKKQLSTKKGFIITNANCSTTGLVVPLKAIEDAFGPLEAVICTTMQAISGGGYPGVPSLDILDNVVPYIGGEEEKIEWEASKILGGLSSDATSFDLRAHQPLRVSASCNRVPVIDGHMASVSIKFSRQPAPSPEQVSGALRDYKCEVQKLGCPSAPQYAIFVHSEDDRPQPRLDRYFQEGAGVSVGRVRKCNVLDIKFTVLSNNVSIGAATSSIINAEYAVLKGIVA